MDEAEQRRAARKRFQARYRALYDEVLELLFQVDPLGVHGRATTEKFVPEVATILPRLRDARCAADVEPIVHEELRRWYGRRHLTGQDPERLARAANAVWSAWQRFLAIR
jgi:hypothetical protein